MYRGYISSGCDYLFGIVPLLASQQQPEQVSFACDVGICVTVNLAHAALITHYFGIRSRLLFNDSFIGVCVGCSCFISVVMYFRCHSYGHCLCLQHKIKCV